jgi:UDP-2,3-diacylglucosamine hydrolase
MKALFISDIHLSIKFPERAEIFFDFLNAEVRQADALYILGDLFDVWIGDDDLTPFNKRVIAALRALSDSGVCIYVMRGNRDFLMGNRFINAIGGKYLEDPSLIQMRGQRMLLSHGDLLCTADLRYQWLRKGLRCWWLNHLFLLLPLKVRRMLANGLRQRSQLSKSHKMKEKMDVQAVAVEKLMRYYQADVLIHGHTHREGQYAFVMDHMSKIRYVLGEWLKTTHYLVCESSEHLPNQLMCQLHHF